MPVSNGIYTFSEQASSMHIAHTERAHWQNSQRRDHIEFWTKESKTDESMIDRGNHCDIFNKLTY